MHVQSPEILDTLGRAAQSGDMNALELMDDMVRNPDGGSGVRMDALSILARYLPAEAGDLAATLVHDEKVSHLLGAALVAYSRSPELIPGLERIAQNQDFVVHDGAMDALVELGGPGSEALARCLVSPHESVRNTAGNAVMRQNFATPSVLRAIDDGRRRFRGESDSLRFSRLKEQLGLSGFAWRVEEVAEQATAQLSALDGSPAPETRPGRFARIFGTRPKPDLPDAGLLDHGRDSDRPLTREESLAQSLVKLAMLEPEVLFELADVDNESVGRQHRIGGRGIDDLELWRAEQRDARLFVPFATQLKESPSFRARVRNLLEELAS